MILSLAYVGTRWLDRAVASRGHLLFHLYLASGLGGLAIEWTLLGNGPGSQAFQPGMFAMWTTFCSGPRVLTRESTVHNKDQRRFLIAYRSEEGRWG